MFVNEIAEKRVYGVINVISNCDITRASTQVVPCSSYIRNSEVQGSYGGGDDKNATKNQLKNRSVDAIIAEQLQKDGFATVGSVVSLLSR